MGRVCWRDWCRNCDKICCRWLTNCFARGNIYRQSARRTQKNMGVFPSGQWGQTVNLLLSASVVRIHPRPPRKRLCRNTPAFFLCNSAAAIDAGGFEPKNRGTPHAGHASVFLMFLFCYLTLPCAPAAAGTGRTRCSARRPPAWKWGPPGRSWSGWRSAGCS